MKKYPEIKSNGYVMEDFNESYIDISSEKRLRTCNAYYGVTKERDFIYLRSYNTIVCVIDTYTKEAFDVLRTEYGYTATSAQHITKFLSDFKSEYNALFRYYYKDDKRYYIRIR